jgi:hypothetical protein
MAKEVQTSRSGEMKQTAEDLDDFLSKVFVLSILSQLEAYIIRSATRMVFGDVPFFLKWGSPSLGDVPLEYATRSGKVDMSPMKKF